MAVSLDLYIPQFEKLLFEYREAFLEPIESILNNERNIGKALNLISNVKISEFVQAGSAKLVEIENAARCYISGVFKEEGADDPDELACDFLLPGYLSRELNDEIKSIIEMIGRYIELSIEISCLIESNSGLSGLVNKFLGSSDGFVMPLVNAFGENSPNMEIKKLGVRLEVAGLQLYQQMSTTLAKLSLLLDKKLEIELELYIDEQLSKVDLE